MKRPHKLLLPLLIVAGCATPLPPPSLAPDESPPPALEREFRGVWVATVANIDWPSAPGLEVAQQQAELLAILDRAAALNLNAVILQVRPATDALYASPYEPWSEYLTGEMGRPPEPFYDPLELAVREAHLRGLELHAWFNPYRARHPSARSEISPDHISRARPELVRRYGAYLWMDPGEEEVQEQSLRVMLDVVRRYDVDGIHIDDYFYPYPERDAAGAPLDFPDEASWTRYREAGGHLSRGDWRRQNVDGFIERLYREIKREKPWVKFGISPFGIWRPGHPPQITTTFDQYEHIYADARRWLVEGWMDYFTPQLYWPIAQTPQSYPVLLRWWVEQNESGRHLWPGNFSSRVAHGNPPFWPAREVLAQIYVTRGQAGATGNVHFSMRVLMQNPDSLVEKLAAEAYPQPALAPASPWLGTDAPGEPRVSAHEEGDGGLRVVAAPAGATLPTWWVVRTQRAAGWTTEILPAFGQPYERRWSRAEEPPRAIAISGVDRVGNEGPTLLLRTGR